MSVLGTLRMLRDAYIRSSPVWDRLAEESRMQLLTADLRVFSARDLFTAAAELHEAARRLEQKADALLKREAA